MRTLIIHPEDNSTDFLKIIYENYNDNFDVITTNVSNSKISKEIKKHEQIIMLGHGNEYGLLSKSNRNSSYFNRLIINSKHVQFLRNKILIGIWCNANIFAEKYKLSGLFSSMIISDLNEALDFGIETTKEEIQIENINFANNLKICINNYKLNDIPKQFSNLNNTKSDLTNFNYNNIFFY